jgi:uncharacterized YccA/Bax inhibitor family protein
VKFGQIIGGMTLITIATYEFETTASIVETRLAFEGIKLGFLRILYSD